MTINSYFDENIDDIKLYNIVMMTIINVNGSLTAFGRSATIIISLASLRAMAHGASLDNTTILTSFRPKIQSSV
jgi:hypothetical protein